MEVIIFSLCVAVFITAFLFVSRLLGRLDKRKEETAAQEKEKNKVDVSTPAYIAKKVEAKIAEFVRERANVKPGDLTYCVYRENVCVKFYANHCAVCWNWWNDGEYVEDEVYYADYPNPAQSREYVQKVRTAVLAIRNPEFTILPDARVIFRKTESSTIR